MTQLYFRYSSIYEHQLSHISGLEVDSTKEDEKYQFVNRYQEYWNRYSDTIFAYYEKLGLQLPEFWLAYFVTGIPKLAPFSDPLTLIIKPNFEEITATLVHELCHVYLSDLDNENIYQELISHTSSVYGNEPFITQIHLIVNVMAAYGLKELFGEEKTRELLSLEKEYSGLKEAWSILDQREILFVESDPFKTIFKL